ncbi:hypothetical protein HMPREF1870_00438 [Bacteroidales bacterium KA00344]|nr:hypothetical protein HMPREF1870_00438 [Bacteroidales bacterium KA00344]
MHLGVYPENTVLIPNSDIEQFKMVNYMNKSSSDFRVFKNKFVFA